MSRYPDACTIGHIGSEDWRGGCVLVYCSGHYCQLFAQNKCLNATVIIFS